MNLTPGLYGGEVVHVRVRPKRHRLSYRVFSLLLDVDQLPELSQNLKLFSYNSRNLFSIKDSDFGDGKSALRPYLDRLSAGAGFGDAVDRYLMLCYPRLLGVIFNPLTIYLGLDRAGEPILAIYEVSNTFGQRQTYVIPVGDVADNTISQTCDKQFFVSPFNDVSGEYLFHIRAADGELTSGVALKTDGQALLRAHFRGQHQPMTDATLVRAALSFGWIGVKTVAGIHYEALKLWLKGLRLQPQPPTDAHRVAHISQRREPAE